MFDIHHVPARAATRNMQQDSDITGTRTGTNTYLLVLVVVLVLILFQELELVCLLPKVVTTLILHLLVL